MGKINYTLLNTSVLNASRLNMTGETGKPGGGAGGYWPAGTPAAIRRSAVLWYDIAKQGATNETMAANPVLKDLSGHGHDATCYNFGWEGMSGVGGYAADFSGWGNNSTQYIELEKSPTKIEVKLDKGSDWIIYTNKPLPQLSVRVSGMKEGDYLEFRYFSEGGTTSLSTFRMESNGIYTLPESFVPNLVNKNSGFASGSVDSTGLVIEFLPLYPGALVSDGVDDYALVEGLPILNKEDGFTVIAKRKWIGDINSKSQGFISKGTNTKWADGAFYFEGVEGGGGYLFNRVFDNSAGKNGTNAISKFTSEDITYLTSKKYNESEIKNIGDGIDTDKLVIFRIATELNNFYGNIALYSLLLFNRDLTEEEIEWVKANIMADPEPEPTPELDASLVDAWIFSDYRNEDAPKSVTGEKGHALTLRNFAFTEGSGFADGCLVTDGVDDYGSCADFPIKDTYTLIVKFATLKGNLFSAACTTTYFDASGARKNGIFSIYIAPGVPYAMMMGRKKNVAASSDLAAVWMNKEAFCGEAYDDMSGAYTPSEGQEGTVYVGKLDDRGIYGGYKLAYWACYDKVMTKEEAEAEIAKLDALWEARKG